MVRIVLAESLPREHEARSSCECRERFKLASEIVRASDELEVALPDLFHIPGARRTSRITHLRTIAGLPATQQDAAGASQDIEK